MRFFFHLAGPQARLPDIEGVELADLNSARQEAEASARELAAAALSRPSGLALDRIEIKDAQGTPLLTIRFCDTVDQPTVRRLEQ